MSVTPSARPSQRPISVVIAAHNEQNVIGRTLDSLLAQGVDRPVEIIVSANGCSDRTAAVATRAGVTVIDRSEPGKAAALNAADAVASGFPRVYLDADIVVPKDGLAAIIEALETLPGVLAVVPRRRVNTEHCPWAVRGYYAVNERLPVFRDGLFGRGLIAISQAGRERFTDFPTVIADDLFLDGQFSSLERAQVDQIEVVVDAPLTTRDLVRRLVRVRRGNSQLRLLARAGQVDAQVRPSDRWAWLREVVLREPRLVVAAIPYCVITLVAAVLARRPARSGQEWGRDESTRAPGTS